MSVFKALSAVNVNDQKMKKGKFDYLPWTDAWTILMKHYPEATHDMLEDIIYADGSMEVRSSVTVDGITHKMFLPVINHQNKAIINPDAFAINKNRMRCLSKNIALFGLGLYIFRGEDLPEPDEGTISPEQIQQINHLSINLHDEDYNKFLEWAGVDKVECIEIKNFGKVHAALEAKVAREYANEEAKSQQGVG